VHVISVTPSFANPKKLETIGFVPSDFVGYGRQRFVKQTAADKPIIDCLDLVLLAVILLANPGAIDRLAV
jgi:hypothetical protein